MLWQRWLTLTLGLLPPGWKQGSDGRGDYKALEIIYPDPLMSNETLMIQFKSLG